MFRAIIYCIATSGKGEEKGVGEGKRVAACGGARSGPPPPEAAARAAPAEPQYTLYIMTQVYFCEG